MNIRRGSRLARKQESATAPVDALVERTDHVLRSLPRRSRLTHREAVLALEKVLLAGETSTAGPTVLEILDPVLSAIAHHGIVERRFVVDALLDVRLALEH